MARKHHSLEVWKKSVNLVTEIYKVTDVYPEQERVLPRFHGHFKEAL